MTTGITLTLAVAVCLVVVTNTRTIDYDDLLMQGDSHGWFENFVNEEKSDNVPKGCGGKPADVMFVMDTSRDVTQQQIDLQKEYLKKLSPLFYMDRDTVRLGVVSSGSSPLTSVHFGSHKTTDSFQRAIDFTPRIGGRRDLAQTLDFLRTKVFPEARPYVAHVVIFMTNGFSLNTKKTIVEGSLLKKTGVYVYTVNLGGKYDKSELSAMASSPLSDFVFGSDDFNIVDPLINLLKIHECSYQIQPPESKPQAACTPRRPVDMVFGVDHLHIGSVNTKTILSFIDELLRDFDHGENLETALLLSKSASVSSLTNRLTDVEKTEEELERVVFPDFSSLLRRTRRTLIRGREGVQKTAVLFIDESVPLNLPAFKEAKRSKFKKMETYVVYIGDNYIKEDLSLIATGSSNIIIVPSYHELDIAKDDILSALCKGL